MTTSTSMGSERSPTDNNNPGPRHEHKRLSHIGATLLAKAFDNVPHERLLVLARYGVWVCSSGSRVSCLVEHNARLSTERGPFLLTPYTHCPKEQLVLDLILFLAYIYNLCSESDWPLHFNPANFRNPCSHQKETTHCPHTTSMGGSWGKVPRSQLLE